MLYSKNEITDKGAGCISHILIKNNKLRSISLHWNRIRYKGGFIIAKALDKNNTIETFDISFNNIGGGHNENQVANTLSDVFRSNKSIGITVFKLILTLYSPP